MLGLRYMYFKKIYELKNKLIVLKAVSGQERSLDGQQSPHSLTEGDANGKINIHVSVVFVKSLSDLKKQRAQSRHGLNTQQFDGNGSIQTSLPTISGCSADVSDDFRRFTGNTAEILNDGSTEKSCCHIM